MVSDLAYSAGACVEQLHLFLSVETKQFGLYKYISASLVSPSWGDCINHKEMILDAHLFHASNIRVRHPQINILVFNIVDQLIKYFPQHR